MTTCADAHPGATLFATCPRTGHIFSVLTARRIGTHSREILRPKGSSRIWSCLATPTEDRCKVLGRALALPSGSGGYVEGWYEGDAEKGGQANAPLYVSRGIGTVFLPIRLGSTPEIAVFDWMGRAPESILGR